MSGIVDIDELILQCRDRQAQEYIKEAVGCYKAGAFKSSIVATWNAVVFDYLHKLNELKLTGDKNAEKKLKEFQAIRDGGDNKLKEALEFEREILNVATDEFELLTLLEKLDLSRLQEDRNRCAHPSMQSDDEPYQPTAELARMHIRNAVDIMLKREPVQGKAAFEQICNQIKSEYFPDDPDTAKVQLEHGPLKRARKALVRNLVIGITRNFIDEDTAIREKKRQIAALSAIFEMHRDKAEDVLKHDLCRIISNVPDERLQRPLLIASNLPIYWLYYNNAFCSRIKSFVRSVDWENRYIKVILSSALRMEELREIAISRIDEVDHSTLRSIVSQLDFDCPILNDKVINKFSSVKSFRSAEAMGRIILLIAEKLTSEQIIKILSSVSANGQINDAGDMEDILVDLFDLTKANFDSTKDQWKALLAYLLEAVQKGTLGLTHGYIRLKTKLEENGITVNIQIQSEDISEDQGESVCEVPDESDIPF